MFLHPINMLYAGPNFHHFFKFFPEVIGYFHSSTSIVNFHQIVALLDLSYHFVIPHFPLHRYELCLSYFKY